MEIFSARLKWLREKKVLTQKEMGSLLGMSGSSYSKYEYGLREPNLETLAKLPVILGESLDFILGVIDEDKHISILFERLESKESQLDVINHQLLQFYNENGFKEHLDVLKDQIKNLKRKMHYYSMEYTASIKEIAEYSKHIPQLSEATISKIKEIEEAEFRPSDFPHSDWNEE